MFDKEIQILFNFIKGGTKMPVKKAKKVVKKKVAKKVAKKKVAKKVVKKKAAKKVVKKTAKKAKK